ncbi:hypothetical protein Cch01nite_36160 [Cellulomonas chitinilytica]|uniref:DUF2505 domain-containing protein n=1 Tax=Cellulomonas chitinilytica TaxID=398759 RepID=A0A919P682_9CELL|nr:hypothetical protein Cch01nite_36160 [Cellulomonas chitinilytica]
MHLSVSVAIATDPTSAAAMLADPEYVHLKLAASGALDQHVDVTGSAPDAFTVTTRRSLPTDSIPAHLRGFVGSSLDVRHVEAWEAAAADGSRAGTVVVEIAGAPVRLTGRASLQPADGGSVLVYEGELHAAIPLFGAAVEQAAAGAVKGALSAEEGVAAQWIADHGTATQP